MMGTAPHSRFRSSADPERARPGGHSPRSLTPGRVRSTPRVETSERGSNQLCVQGDIGLEHSGDWEFCSASCANRVCGVIQILFLEAIRGAEAI